MKQCMWHWDEDHKLSTKFHMLLVKIFHRHAEIKYSNQMAYIILCCPQGVTSCLKHLG